jgi:putative ABC transport system permease protein
MKPYTVVLLKPVADKLFDHIDPVGETITIDNSQCITDYTVTGEVEAPLTIGN